MNEGIVWRSAGSLTEMTPCFPHRWGVCWPSGLLLEQVFMTMLGKPKSKRKLPSVIICCTEDGSCCISYPGDILDSNSSSLASWNPLTPLSFHFFCQEQVKAKKQHISPNLLKTGVWSILLSRGNSAPCGTKLQLHDSILLGFKFEWERSLLVPPAILLSIDQHK